MVGHGADVPPPRRSQSRGAPAGDHWRAYWESIADRHEVFRAEARDHVERLRRLVPLDKRMHVLDFGCGFGFVAEQLAAYVARVAAWDGSANVRRRARVRIAHVANVELIDLSQPDVPPAQRFDLITVHSVIQYMAVAEIRQWLRRWAALLKPGGRLVLSDLIQPETSALRETLGYLAFCARSGFLVDGVAWAAREFAQYSHARRRCPLTCVTLSELRQWAGEAGLTVEALGENLSYRTTRLAAVLRG